jgi:hypothetical protein
VPPAGTISVYELSGFGAKLGGTRSRKNTDSE